LRIHRLTVRTLALCLCVLLLASGLTAAAREITLNVNYIPITRYGYVADTFNGVKSLYNPYGTNYDCGELIHRYYEEVYGLEISLSGNRAAVVGNENYWFVEAEEPQPGDIFYASAYSRGKAYGHWAICKAVDPEAGTITMFEQNWRWNGMAGVGRQIPYEGNCYTYFHLTNAENYVLTLAQQAEREALRQQILMELEAEAARQAAQLLLEKQQAEFLQQKAELREKLPQMTAAGVALDTLGMALEKAEGRTLICLPANSRV